MRKIDSEDGLELYTSSFGICFKLLSGKRNKEMLLDTPLARFRLVWSVCTFAIVPLQTLWHLDTLTP